jgi:hypothetical protein
MCIAAIHRAVGGIFTGIADPIHIACRKKAIAIAVMLVFLPLIDYDSFGNIIPQKEIIDGVGFSNAGIFGN